MLINKVFRQYVPSADEETRAVLGLNHEWKSTDFEATYRTESEIVAEGYVSAADQLPSTDRSIWIFIDHESRTYAIPPPIRKMPMPRAETYGHAPVQKGCEMRLLSLGGAPEGYALSKSLQYEIFMVARYFIVNEGLREYKTIPNGVGNPTHVMPVWPRFDAWIGKPGRCYITTERPGAGFTCLDDPTAERITIVNDQRREYAVCDPSFRNVALPYRWAAHHYNCISANESAPEGYAEVPLSISDAVADDRTPRDRFLINHTRREYIEMRESNAGGIQKFGLPDHWIAAADEIEARSKCPKRYKAIRA
jgi:hypothetical protein